jgi:hypothetical protein
MAHIQTPSAAAVNNLRNGWAALHPDLVGRLDRAVALVANVTPGDRSEHVFFVEGSNGRQYMVRVDPKAHSTCTCPDHKRTGSWCKHVLAVMFYLCGQEKDSK